MDNFRVGTRFKGAKNCTIEIIAIPENSDKIKVKYISSGGYYSKTTYDYNKGAAVQRVRTRFIGNKITKSKLWKTLNG